MVVGDGERDQTGGLPIFNILGSIVVSILACHARDRGSIPRRGEIFFPNFIQFFFFLLFLLLLLLLLLFLLFFLLLILPLMRRRWRTSAMRVVIVVVIVVVVVAAAAAVVVVVVVIVVVILIIIGAHSSWMEKKRCIGRESNPGRPRSATLWNGRRAFYH